MKFDEVFSLLPAAAALFCISIRRYAAVELPVVLPAFGLLGGGTLPLPKCWPGSEEASLARMAATDDRRGPEPRGGGGNILGDGVASDDLPSSYFPSDVMGEVRHDFYNSLRF